MIEGGFQAYISSELSSIVGSKVTILSVEPLGGGCINIACKITSSEGLFFLKYNHSEVGDMFLREEECLRELAIAGSSLRIPKVYLSQEKQGYAAFILMEFMENNHLQSKNLDESLGVGIAHIHRYQKEKYGFYNDNYCGATLQKNDWETDWVTFFGQHRIVNLLQKISIQRALSNAERKTYDRLIERLPMFISHKPVPSLNHGDLWSGNYMQTDEGPALIDPASYYADREFDLALMEMFGGYNEVVWYAYRDEYPLEPGYQDRRQLYMLYHYLNHYYLFGGSYREQSLSIAKKYT